MRNFLYLLLAIAAIGCGGREPRYTPPENALDAGRSFIESCMNGDFQKADYYLVDDNANKEKLELIEGLYRQKDKEGRQQYRQASINLHEVREISADTTWLFYSNTVDKTMDSLRIVRMEDRWQVQIADLNQTN